MPPVSIDQLKLELEKTRKELLETTRKQRLTSDELNNMIKAQGNLYRFQEKIEQQKVLYAQVAQVGHTFNETLNFQEILKGLDRFVLDLLNFEKYVLMLKKDNEALSVHHMAGLFSSETTVRKLSIPIQNTRLPFLASSDARLLLLQEQQSEQAEFFRQSCEMSELMIYRLGGAGNQIKGLLVVGNSQKNAHLHQRVVADEDMDSLFSNFTSMLQGALTNIQFLEQIQLESKQVKRLLNNMQQAVFSMDSAGLVVDPVSRFSEQIFGHNISGQNIWTTVLKDLPKKSEARAGLETAFSVVFGESELQWELMEDQFPKQIPYYRKTDETERTLRISFRPIWSDAELLEKIMLVVEDITELLLLEKQASKDREEIQIIQELAKNSIENIENSFTRTIELFGQLNPIIRQITQDRAEIGNLMRTLHTLKGNARLYNMSLISQEVHEAEAHTLEIKNQWLEGTITAEQCTTQLRSEIQKVQHRVFSYSQVAERVFNISNQFETYLLEDFFHHFGEVVQNLTNENRSILQNQASALGAKELLLALSDGSVSAEALCLNISQFLLSRKNFRAPGLDDAGAEQLLEELRQEIEHSLTPEQISRLIHSFLEVWDWKLASAQPEFGKLQGKLKSYFDNSLSLAVVLNRRFHFLLMLRPLANYSSSPDGVRSLRLLEVADISVQRLEKTISKLNANPDPKTVEEIKRNFRRLQEVPVKPMLQKFSNMVKEVSKTLEKSVEYRVLGEDVTLDKERLNTLSDALVQLIRNGIDHGIEKPEDRVRNHKNETGLLEIQVSENRGQMNLIVLDDGRGMDPEDIARIAEQKGVITAQEKTKLSPEEKLHLIFKPGFSTKQQATELSGRGVGMDIVANLVRKLGGKLTLTSRKGIGSEFHISIRHD